MQKTQSQKLFTIVLELPKGETKEVKIRASSREVAENRALKHNPRAEGVKSNA